MKRSLSFISSMIVLISYLLFTFLSIMKFPVPYSPINNWLSDLGSYVLNPGGAIFYNVGIVAAGISLFLFFLGLSCWAIAGNKKQNVMLYLTQLFGCLGALAMVMSALFPINIQVTHSFLSASLYILIGTAFGFSVSTFRYYSKYPRWLLFLGIFVVLEDLFWSLVMNITILEWLTVVLFLFYVMMLGIETRRKKLFIG